jgi:hypothetical protein
MIGNKKPAVCAAGFEESEYKLLHFSSAEEHAYVKHRV